MNSTHVQRLVDQHYGIDQQQLQIQGHTVSDLATQFGTPFFVYDRDVLDHSLKQLKTAFGKEFGIYYSMKANPDPRIVKFFTSQSAGIEIASAGEFRTSIQSGCLPENIIFAGPGKTAAELEETITQGIGEIHVESENEFERIHSIGEACDKVVNVCIRINPEGQQQGGAMRMGGLASPFGIDEEKIPDVVEHAKRFPRASIRGIHLFLGTQILDAATLVSQYRRFIVLAANLAELLNKPLQTIDFGGGLGIPYFENEIPLDLDSVTSDLRQLGEQVRRHPMLRETRLIIEPGRYLTAEAGIYVARILDIKESRGTQFVVTDGGMHHHLAATGNLGQVIKRNFPIACVTKLGRPNETEAEIVGPLCTPLDRLGRKIPLPKIEPGDLIGVFCSGAYARSASPNDFLSHGAPVELYVEGDSVSAIQLLKSGNPDG